MAVELGIGAHKARKTVAAPGNAATKGADAKCAEAKGAEAKAAAEAQPAVEMATTVKE